MMYRISMILVATLLLFGCASQQYVPQADEELYGTWINTDYSGRGMHFRKMVYSPSGDFRVYRFAADAPAESLTFTIIDKWSDSEGNIFYKIHFVDAGVLAKISNNANVFESLLYHSYPPGFPTKLDPKDPAGYYRIYYRQK